MSKRDQAISISIRVVPLVSIHHALLLYRFDSVKRVTNCISGNSDANPWRINEMSFSELAWDRFREFQLEVWFREEQISETEAEPGADAETETETETERQRKTETGTETITDTEPETGTEPDS